jgi:hypothetical protein
MHRKDPELIIVITQRFDKLRRFIARVQNQQ